MKNWVVYISLFFVSVASLAPNMQGMQLIKLPNLVSHVEYHFGADWTFTELKSFLTEHYQSNNLPNDKEHKSLPFKSSVGTSLTIAIQNTNPVLISISSLSENKNTTAFFNLTNPTRDCSKAIWTPPQLS
jgi:hypothetical protein